MSNEKKELDRNLWFSQRYGYIPLPNVMDPTLCKKFRDSLWIITMDSLKLSVVQGTNANHSWKNDVWENIAKVFQQEILDKSPWEITTEPINVGNIIPNAVRESEFHAVLSLIEIILREVSRDFLIRKNIYRLFKKKLAPYAIDDSAEPVCIIPLDCPENAENIIKSLETLHETGAERPHQYLRKAAGHINSNNYNSAVAESTHALESIARDITREKTLGDAARALHSQGIIPHPALSEAIVKLYAFASDTARHGQPSDKQVNIDRDEALLVFGLSTSLSAYLARKKLEINNV